jgi:hypothetical protein
MFYDSKFLTFGVYAVQGSNRSLHWESYVIHRPKYKMQDLLIVKAGGTYSYHWALKGYHHYLHSFIIKHYPTMTCINIIRPFHSVLKLQETFC